MIFYDFGRDRSRKCVHRRMVHGENRRTRARSQVVPGGRVRRTAPLAALTAKAAGDGVVDVLRRRLQGERGGHCARERAIRSSTALD